jgi:hypothetical protein
MSIGEAGYERFDQDPRRKRASVESSCALAFFLAVMKPVSFSLYAVRAVKSAARTGQSQPRIVRIPTQKRRTFQSGIR